MKTFITLLLAAAALQAASDRPHGKIVDGSERLLYVTDRRNLSIYDINDGHKFLRHLEVADTGDFKGISASPQLGKLYLASYLKDDLVCVDLLTDQVLWRKKYGKYADSTGITPDGKTLYVPYREEDSWWVLNAENGDIITKINTQKGRNYDVNPIGNPVGPHNTWLNREGSRVYMEVLTVPYLFIADTKTNRIIGKIGPFSKGIRPFAINDAETRAYASIDGLLGFEIGSVRTGDQWGGPMTRRVETTTPAERLAQIPNPPAHKPHSTPSHGVNIRPDQKEIWAVDGVYGYVYVWDISNDAPKQIASIPLFADPKEQPHPGWITFGIDGKYAYPDGGAVIDAYTKKVVARIPTSEKLLEIDFKDGKPVKAGHR